jgi:CheY-like chemotaxis protein
MHQVSNWWGVYQIWDVRNQARIDNAPLKLPDRVLKEVRKLDGKQALCLYGEDNPPPMSEADGDALYKLETEVYNAGPRLALIDDEADMGWSDVLRSTLSSKDTKSEQLDKYVKTLRCGKNLEQVLAFDPDVVLLDLRLRGNDEIGAPVANTSGANVLRAIRKLDCGLPVILMTASNKYWTYRVMLKLGADGYWMKEGLGEHRPLVSAAEHYSELLRLMLLCIGRPIQQSDTATRSVDDADTGYRDLRVLSRAFNKLKRIPAPWWTNATWPTPRIGRGQAPSAKQAAAFQATKAPRDHVEAQYENSLSLLRSYLQGHLAGLTFVAHRDITSAASEELRAIGMAAGKVIEIVHCFDKLQAAGIDGKAQHIGGHGGDTFRKDYLGQALYRFRNDCAHAGNTPPTFAQVRDYIALILAYLQCEPELGSIYRGTLLLYVARNNALKNAYYALRGTDAIESYLANLVP